MQGSSSYSYLSTGNTVNAVRVSSVLSRDAPKNSPTHVFVAPALATSTTLAPLNQPVRP